jgi:hypothetical protein
MDIPGIAGAMEGSKERQIKRRKQGLPAKQEIGETLGKEVCDELHTFFAFLRVRLPLVASVA